MGRLKIRDRGISTRTAKQIRMGIATGEVIYNLIIKDEISAARLAMVRASRTSKKTYLATLHTVWKRMGCTPRQFML